MLAAERIAAPIGYWLKHLDGLIEAAFERTLAGQGVSPAGTRGPLRPKFVASARWRARPAMITAEVRDPVPSSSRLGRRSANPR
jgi:hypothetical protein